MGRELFRRYQSDAVKQRSRLQDPLEESELEMGV